MLQVMIRDDDMNVRKCLRQLIPWPETGCEIVAEASNGAEGLERFHAVRPDVVISDLKMPEMSGEELCTRIRAVSDHVAIIFLSAYEDFNVSRQALHYGVMEYILKPIDTKKLKQITELLRQLSAAFHNRSFVHSLLQGDSFPDELSLEFRNGNAAYFEALFQKLSDSLETDFSLLLNVCTVLINLLFDTLEKLDESGESLHRQRQTALAELSGFSRKTEATAFCRELYFDYLTGQAPGAKEQSFGGRTVEQVKLYIMKNLHWQQLGLPAIAAHFGFSEDYLSKLFKREAGENISSYITCLRLNHACRLLKNTQLTISEIALACGYSSSNYFCRSFKKQLELTPNEYRLHEISRNRSFP